MSTKRRNGERMVPAAKVPSLPSVGAERPFAFDGDAYTSEQMEWLRAVDAYRLRAGKVVLSAREVLTLARSLGYRKVEHPQPLPSRRKR